MGRKATWIAVGLLLVWIAARERRLHLIREASFAASPVVLLSSPPSSRSSASIAAPETPLPKKGRTRPTIEQLVGKLRADQFCTEEGENTFEYAATPGRYTRIHSDLYLALARANSEEPSPCIAAVYSRTLADVLRWTENRSEPLCRLWRGLALTDQLYIDHPRTKDQIREGLDILTTLSKQEPQVGFYSFVLFGPMKWLNVDRSEMVEAMHRYLKASRPDLPWENVTSNLRRLGRLNATAYLAADIVQQIPGGPYLKESLDAAKEMLNDSQFRDEFTAWATRLSLLVEFAGTDEFKNSSLELYKSLRMGWLIAQSAWSLFVGSPLPRGLQPESMDAASHRLQNIEFGGAWAKVSADSPCVQRHRELTALLPETIRADDELEAAWKGWPNFDKKAR